MLFSSVSWDRYKNKCLMTEHNFSFWWHIQAINIQIISKKSEGSSNARRKQCIIDYEKQAFKRIVLKNQKCEGYYMESRNMC